MKIIFWILGMKYMFSLEFQGILRNEVYGVGPNMIGCYFGWVWILIQVSCYWEGWWHKDPYFKLFKDVSMVLNTQWLVKAADCWIYWQSYFLLLMSCFGAMHEWLKQIRVDVMKVNLMVVIALCLNINIDTYTNFPSNMTVVTLDGKFVYSLILLWRLPGKFWNKIFFIASNYIILWAYSEDNHMDVLHTSHFLHSVHQLNSPVPVRNKSIYPLLVC